MIKRRLKKGEKMDASFWHQRWENNEIGFHESEANSLLVEYFDALSLLEGSRVFLPLCGKTLDIAWLLSKGCRVVGAELSKVAIEQLFEGLGLEPNIVKIDNVFHYSTKNIDIYVGDIFELSQANIGPVDAVYDRAALVALPEDVRRKYTSHIVDITKAAQQILLTFEYDQHLMDGPPFSISDKEVAQHYSKYYELKRLTRRAVAGGLKGTLSAVESVWFLKGI